MRRGQQGITLLGFIVVLVVLACVAYLAMRLIPMYTEYFQIVKALKGTLQEPGMQTATEYKIQDNLNRRFDIGYVESIQPKDVKIKREQNGMSLSVDYEVRKHVAYNIDLIGHFQDTEGAAAGTAKPSSSADQ